MKNLITIAAIVGGLYLIASTLGIGPFEGDGMPPEAEAAYKGYAEAMLSNNIRGAKEHATGAAAELSDQRSNMQKWLMGGKYVAASNYEIKRFEKTVGEIEMETLFRYVPSGGMLGDRNPGSPKNWRSARHEVTLENTGRGWKVARFSATEGG